MKPAAKPKKIAIVGGGPAGLMAAQTAAGQGFEVHVFERKASVGRKFLIAGRGGLNLTHAEPMAEFTTRFRHQNAVVSQWLTDFDNTAIRQWAQNLGVETFVGSSERVFPTDMKAAPLLRAWLKYLREGGVQFHVNQHCTGIDAALNLQFESKTGQTAFKADAIVFALGGASWPQLGSDGQWQLWLLPQALKVEDLQAANCGFNVPWTDFFKTKFAGAPLKPLRIALAGQTGQALQGECVISEYGIEGSLIYALSADIRDTITHQGSCTIMLDLLPDHSHERLLQAASKPRNGRSLSDFLRRHFNLPAVKTALLYELANKADLADPGKLVQLLKALPLKLHSTRPIAEAISTAGGVALPQLDEHLMWRALPGVFFAGEMLDWEAPTGGYLLSASLASGRLAGLGAMHYLQKNGVS